MSEMTYRQAGDYQIPNIKLKNTETKPLGKYGRMRRAFLQENNPMLLNDDIDRDKLFRVYVSALTTLNIDDHNRIHTTDARLLRRLVRDYETRGASMEHTLSRWPSVRRGEEKWIFPYQENADALFNTTLVYEVSVLKKYVYPLLQEVPKESPCYAAARDITKVLNYFLDADGIEDEIPPTSILREFIGGCTFYRKD